jgi:hypothetical protein
VQAARNPETFALRSRKNAENDHEENSAYKAGDENQSASGRIEDDRPAPNLDKVPSREGRAELDLL